jgi:hypothetical protein
MDLYVQFSDETETIIIGFASAPQPPETWPIQGVVTTADARWKTYYEAASDFQKQFLPSPTSE